MSQNKEEYWKWTEKWWNVQNHILDHSNAARSRWHRVGSYAASYLVPQHGGGSVARHKHQAKLPLLAFQAITELHTIYNNKSSKTHAKTKNYRRTSQTNFRKHSKINQIKTQIRTSPESDSNTYESIRNNEPEWEQLAHTSNKRPRNHPVLHNPEEQEEQKAIKTHRPL